MDIDMRNIILINILSLGYKNVNVICYKHVNNNNIYVLIKK